MPSPERPAHRPSLDEVAKNDPVDVARPNEVEDELPELAPLTSEPVLDVFDAHKQATMESRLHRVTGSERTNFIRWHHQENHKRTQKQAITEIQKQVRPSEDGELSESDDEYYSQLESSVSDILSKELSGESGLESELATVVAIESIEDEETREAARAAAIERLALKLSARREDAERIYSLLADQVDTYRAILQQKQVLLILQQAPDRYDEFMAVAEQGDAVAIDSFLQTLGNSELQSNIAALRGTELRVEAFIEERELLRLNASHETFGRFTRNYGTLETTEQRALGQIALESSPDFLSFVENLSLAADHGGLSGRFLDRPVRIENGTCYLGATPIRSLSGHGIREAVAVESARHSQCKVFGEIGDRKAGLVLEPLMNVDRIEFLPTENDIQQLQALLTGLQLNTSAADGWLVLRELELLDSSGQPNAAGIRRLQRQIQALRSTTRSDGQSSPFSILIRIAQFWESEGLPPERSTILSAPQARSL